MTWDTFANITPVRQTLHRALSLLKTEHRRARFDVLHGLWGLQSGLLATLAGRWLRVPTVVTVAGAELVALPQIGYGAQLSRRSRGIVRFALRLADRVTTGSDYMLHTLQVRRPDARRIVLGADCTRFAPPASFPFAAASRSANGEPWRLLHVASLNRVKDQPTLLRAFVRILCEEPEARLEIIGEDTLHGAIQRLACDLGIGEAVTFRGFQVSDVVACRMGCSDLLLHTSLSEVGPVAFLEAAACGVPTVGTAVGLIADAAALSAAVAVPVGDEAGLAAAALALRRDPVRYATLAASALAFARAHDAETTAVQFETLYAELAGRNAKR